MRSVPPDGYLFIGGPWDGRRVKTDGVRVFRVPVADTLEGQLRQSIQLLGGGEVVLDEPPGASAEYSFRVAQYVLGRRVIVGNITPIRDRRAYRFEGYE